MALNPLLHVIQSCAGGRSKGEISAFVDSIAPEVSAGRVFPLSAALQQRRQSARLLRPLLGEVVGVLLRVEDRLIQTDREVRD